MKLTPQLVTAVGALITAIAGLWTAIHAHGKATAAQGSADTANALGTLVRSLLPLLANSVPVSTIPGLTRSVEPTALTVEHISEKQPPTAPSWAPELETWLREQHREATGSYPGSPNTPVTDFTKVLDEISRLEGG